MLPLKINGYEAPPGWVPTQLLLHPVLRTEYLQLTFAWRLVLMVGFAPLKGDSNAGSIHQQSAPNLASIVVQSARRLG